MPTDFYELLDVPREADAATIKASYRKLALKYHPDRNRNDPDAEETFKRLNEAYAVLSDPEKRARYDRYGEAEPGVGMGGGGDIFDIFASVFGSGFATGGARTGPTRGQPGEDLEARLTITLEQARDGATVSLAVERMTRCDRCGGDQTEPGKEGRTSCPTCGGMGQVRQQAQSLFGTVMTQRTCPRCRGAGSIVTDPCTACSGRGRNLHEDEIEVTLPEGIDGGYRLRVPGEGNAGVDGGPDGDLYVYLDLAPHEHFVRDGDDLRYPLEVGPAQAALGSSFEVPTLDGPEVLEVPAGTQHGTEFRLRGKGMPRLRRSGNGDQIVTVRIVVPNRLPRKAREALLAYAEAVGEPIHEKETLLGRIRDVFQKRKRKRDEDPDANGEMAEQAEKDAKGEKVEA